MTMKTTKGLWKILGINLISSDEIYKKIKSAIEEGKLYQDYLQKQTGHLSPITIDMQNRTIDFSRF